MGGLDIPKAETGPEDSLKRRFLVHYLNFMLSTTSIQAAVYVVGLATFLTVIMLPVTLGTLVYQSVSGYIIDFPTQHLRGVVAGALVALTVFWALFGAVIAIGKAVLGFSVNVEERDA